RILDHEVDAARDPREMMVNEQNYRFDYDGEESVENVPCYRLTIAPKHDRKDLLNATIWVDRNSYRIVRVEGEPAKSPSFWVKDVHLVLDLAKSPACGCKPRLTRSRTCASAESTRSFRR